MKSAQNMKPGDVSLGLSHHFIGAFGRAGGTAEMLQQAADDRLLMQKLVELFQPTVLAAATFVTSTYFVTRPGLWVSDDFTSQITPAYPEAFVPRGLVGVESFDLAEASSDFAIIAHPEIGGEENVRKHPVVPDQIGALIDLQPKGEAGQLLTNGFSNLFLVVGKDGKLFVVRLDWGVSHRRWFVSVCRFNESGVWCAGHRFFRNTQVLKV